jgi:hypothetical protein
VPYKQLCSALYKDQCSLAAQYSKRCLAYSYDSTSIVPGRPSIDPSINQRVLLANRWLIDGRLPLAGAMAFQGAGIGDQGRVRDCNGMETLHVASLETYHAIYKWEQLWDSCPRILVFCRWRSGLASGIPLVTPLDSCLGWASTIYIVSCWPDSATRWRLCACVWARRLASSYRR